MNDPTIWNTPATGCPACREWRRHTDEEREKYHPYSRHGYDRKQWSHPELESEARNKSALRESDGLAAPGPERGRS